VAGADYWLQSAARRFIGERVFRAVFIPRGGGAQQAQDLMCAALDGGASLIVFPEGTRNTTEDVLLPFRSGLYWLCKARPDIECVPVWIANISRVLPKGEFLPIPLLCTLTFGTPMTVGADEDKSAFIERARDALLALGQRGNGE
jgi:1-acyl-sn-glycerol-3-phosphate acyltransferase